MAIYLQLAPDQQFNNIDELLTYGYLKVESAKFLATYHDKECTQQQCYAANRSLEDLIEICQTYFPGTTPADVAKILYYLNSTIGVSPFICGDIEKVVFNCEKGFTFEDFLESFPGEENYKGKGDYSYNDIIKLVNK